MYPLGLAAAAAQLLSQTENIRYQTLPNIRSEPLDDLQRLQR